MNQNELTIDGMTFEQTRHNVYMLTIRLTSQITKRDHARTEPARAKWQKRIDATARLLGSNRERLKEFINQTSDELR